MAIAAVHSKRFLATAAAAAYASSSSFASAFISSPKAVAAPSAHQLHFSTSCVVRTTPGSFSLSSSNDVNFEAPNFRRYDKIQVEVVRFGKLGASVEVIGLGHKEEDCIGEEEPALGLGLILQREIQYFRSGRGGLDVIVGEVLPAYVERVRDDGRLDISLRDPGGKGKADTIGSAIMAKLREAENGTLDIGDKSTPDEINSVFPGTSKGAFKKAVAALYKKGLVQPGKNTISLLSEDLKHD